MILYISNGTHQIPQEGILTLITENILTMITMIFHLLNLKGATTDYPLVNLMSETMVDSPLTYHQITWNFVGIHLARGSMMNSPVVLLDQNFMTEEVLLIQILMTGISPLPKNSVAHTTIDLRFYHFPLLDQILMTGRTPQR